MRADYRIVWNSLPLQAVDPGPTGIQSSLLNASK
jgi:hypothetical protein